MKITNCGKGIHQREIPGLEKLKDLPENWYAFTNLDLALPGKGVREIDVVMVIEDWTVPGSVDTTLSYFHPLFELHRANVVDR